MNIPRPLSLAIEQLYVVFARYPRSYRVEGCSPCSNEEDHDRLLAVPLRELTEEHLARFVFQVLTTRGEGDIFRHFLPRLFELVTTNGLGVEPEVLFGKLRQADWDTWPKGEQVAVRTYLSTLWSAAVLGNAHCEPPLNTNTCLCAIAQAEDDLTPYLESWMEVLVCLAPTGITDFLEWNLPNLAEGGTLSSVFWSGREVQEAQVVCWLRSTDVVEEITENLRGDLASARLGTIFRDWVDAWEETSSIG